MSVLARFTCVVLAALSAQAKVVSQFTDCQGFFYESTAPSGMDQNAKKICQMLEDNGEFYFATLYSVHHRIPLYSAYVFDPLCSETAGRKDVWYLEPQISSPQIAINHMVRPSDLRTELDLNTIKRYQAINSDYSDTGYDRGHLNPNGFQCNDARNATFTLTNAAPMDACFNRVQWKNWEDKLKMLLQREREGTAYIVTGTVPNANLRIPQRPQPQNSNRVTVPSHIWTAVCFKHQSDPTKSYSFAYIGDNQPVNTITLQSVSALNDLLSRLYGDLSGTSMSIKVFVDDCFGDDDKLKKLQTHFSKLINQLAAQHGLKHVQMTSGVMKTAGALKRMATSNIHTAKIPRVVDMIVKLAFDSQRDYSIVTEDLKGSAGVSCLITNTTAPARLIAHDELRKRQVREVSREIECTLVPDQKKTAADGSLCSSVTETNDKCECTVGGETKLCCSTPCLYEHKVKGYRCTSGQQQIDCSPQYSLITVDGERCRDDHPCATYGYGYYWCYKSSGGWGYCSPPLWQSKAKTGQYCRINHACAYYDRKYPWCYTDDRGTYDSCCISDDCYSAVNGKTCKSDHHCAFHGQKYLWCYTTDGSWDKCCKYCGD